MTTPGINIMPLVCKDCAVQFGVDTAVFRTRWMKGNPIYCPNGHAKDHPQAPDQQNGADYIVGTCAVCTVPVGLAYRTYNQRVADAGPFWCPIGHENAFANKNTIEPYQTAGTLIRAGDAERAVYQDRLADAYAGGYLTKAEWETRYNRTLEATTINDLAPLTADLPYTHDMPAPPKQLQKKPEPPRRRLTPVFWAAIAASMPVNLMQFWLRSETLWWITAALLLFGFIGLYATRERERR